MTGQIKRAETIEVEAVAIHEQVLGVLAKEGRHVLDVFCIIQAAMILSDVLGYVIDVECAAVLEERIPLHGVVFVQGIAKFRDRIVNCHNCLVVFVQASLPLSGFGFCGREALRV